MSELKITKGTWTADVTRVVIGKTPLFTQEWWDSCEEMEEAKANAFLAAAAPEMYVMLEQLVEAVKTLNAISLIKIKDKLIEDAANIINKARGEE